MVAYPEYVIHGYEPTPTFSKASGTAATATAHIEPSTSRA